MSYFNAILLKAVILAAGYGSRLQPFTSHRPKQMLPVGGKPILQHGLEYIRDKLEIKDIILVVGYLRESIMSYFGDGSKFGIQITYVIQHLTSKRGLGAALNLVYEHINSDFCLYLADNLFLADLKQVVEKHKSENAVVTLHIEEHNNPSRFGVVVTNEKDQILKVIEKPKEPPSNDVITGFYVFSPLIFNFLQNLKSSGRGEYELTDAIQSAIEKGYKVIASKIKGWRQDIGFAEDVLSSNLHLMQDIGSKINSETQDCEIIEPVFIDEGCQLTGSKIGPYATIGKNCIIKNSIIESSVILESSNINESELHLSVIGSNCVISKLKTSESKIGDYSEFQGLL